MNWSRDYFAMAKAAASKMDEIREELTRRHSALVLQAQRYFESRTVGDLDPQRAMDEYIDAEREAECELADLQAQVDDALGILYGFHGRGGVAKLYSRRCADCINWRWLQRRKWADVAADLDCTARWAQQLESDAFDFMDRYGESAIRSANGIDEDYIDSMRWEGD